MTKTIIASLAAASILIGCTAEITPDPGPTKKSSPKNQALKVSAENSSATLPNEIYIISPLSRASYQFNWTASEYNQLDWSETMIEKGCLFSVRYDIYVTEIDGGRERRFYWNTKRDSLEVFKDAKYEFDIKLSYMDSCETFQMNFQLSKKI